MAKLIRFGSPALINKLDKLYGSESSSKKQNVTLRESQGIDQFLKEKEDWQKRSLEVKIKFKK